MKRIAVLDTSLISTWLKIQRQFDLFELLPNIAEYALVPQKVVEEIARHSPEGERPEGRQRFLDSITDAHGFYRLCTTIDAVILNEISTLPKVDPGEAEALAQDSVVQADWILMDDKASILEKVFPQVSFHNSIVILEIMNQAGLLPDAKNTFEALHSVRAFGSKHKAKALKKAQQWLQL